ncbi:glycosyltransferase [Lactiplantibacillus argentoratensis]|jgi:glycosyltransferase involved in cell wall biosynthesis|uniref:glycosyltransferase family 2 protein n=1 Tax=Lactiplantibacillus argentoratensis TaxID=271881 RepID=UPI001CE22AE2|nr:glycosyltransferase family 2 protein [Lactiplantibacillus argentoratensis]MCA5599149.1 glycosyltransferase [Lactiplantibacillus argentoratensis]
MSKLVSIIVPVFNGERFLPAFFDRILSQSYQNYEVIFVDDGSTDNTFRILKDNERFDKRYKVIHQQNTGVSAARNQGIRLASGEYIAFWDVDDEFSDLYLEKMVRKFEDTQVQLVISGYMERQVNQNLSFNYSGQSTGRDFNWLLQQIVTHRGIGSALWNKCFQTHIIKANKVRFDEQVSIGEDLLFLVQYMTVINDWVEIPDILYTYNLSDQSTMQNYKHMTYFDRRWLSEWDAVNKSENLLKNPSNKYDFKHDVLILKKIRVSIKLLGRIRKFKYQGPEKREMRTLLRKNWLKAIRSDSFTNRQKLKMLVLLCS